MFKNLDVLSNLELEAAMEKAKRADKIKTNQFKEHRQEKIKTLLAFGGEPLVVATQFVPVRELTQLRRISISQ